MIDIKSKRCIQEGCKIRPAFNNEYETKALYCSSHKLEGMVNVISKTCIYPDCKIIPVYNIEGKTTALYCSAHKKEEMIDIKSKRCIHEGCNIQASYNKECETKRLYCLAHKLEGMINVISNICIHEGCNVIAAFNNKCETKELYCFSHKLEGMVDIKNKKCKSNLCYTRPQKKYDGYCLYCYMNLFPDKPVSRNYKTKEYTVVEFVKTTFPDLSWTSDKRILDGCSKRRPDLFLDLGHQIIIIEIDENQHAKYDCSCENKRIMELSQDVGHKPIVFIRFNPDDYEENEIVIKSCWGVNNKGICVIKKIKEWTLRLNSLKEQITYWIYPNNITTKTIEIIQLFYDI